MKSQRKGFTLIELLIVIGIIGFLAAAILVAVDPVKRIQDARNARRWAEVNSMLSAILTKQVDDRALFTGNALAPVIQGTKLQVIVNDSTGMVCNSGLTRPSCRVPGYALTDFDVAAANKNCVADIGGLAPTYIAAIPVDPLGSGNPCPVGTADVACILPGNIAIGTTGATSTGYYLNENTSGRIEIGACFPDQGAAIKVKR